uniref:Secreted protein n=1 Tax=Trichogramma kaykai TaxID=54128 RepID=A0ABD2XHS0_9HYME
MQRVAATAVTAAAAAAAASGKEISRLSDGQDRLDRSKTFAMIGCSGSAAVLAGPLIRLYVLYAIAAKARLVFIDVNLSSSRSLSAFGCVGLRCDRPDYTRGSAQGGAYCFLPRVGSIAPPRPTASSRACYTHGRSPVSSTRVRRVAASLRTSLDERPSGGRNYRAISPVQQWHSRAAESRAGAAGNYTAVENTHRPRRSMLGSRNCINI